MDTDSLVPQTIDDLRSLIPNTALQALGIELVKIDEERIVLTMPITDAARQPMGLLHGGVNLVLAESAASMHACFGVDLARVIPVAIEINGTHVRSAKDGTVRAIGTVIRRTRSFIFHEVKLFHAESGNLLSMCRVTNYYRPIPEER